MPEGQPISEKDTKSKKIDVEAFWRWVRERVNGPGKRYEEKHGPLTRNQEGIRDETIQPGRESHTGPITPIDQVDDPSAGTRKN